jgi:hypothetical protein
MDSDRFDALSRRLSSRRTALTGLVGGVAAILGVSATKDVAAHNLAPACQKITDPVKRRKCLVRARRHKRQQHSCKPRPLAVTCANRCGRFQNNCRKAVNCTCAAGKLCMSNTSCSRFCHPVNLPCPPGCICGLFAVETPTTPHCIPASITSCAQLTQVCASSAECPPGHFCSTGSCPMNVCAPVCQV